MEAGGEKENRVYVLDRAESDCGEMSKAEL